MKSKIRKIINIICILLILLTSNFGMLESVVQAANASVHYNGTAEYGGSKVRKFFC